MTCITQGWNLMRKGSFLAAVLFIAAGALGTLSAQNATTTGQIRGRVVNEGGQAIAGASVVARNTETGLERGAVTGSDGSYTLRLLPSGTYRVRAEMLGTRTGELPSVRVTIGQSATANFTLTPQAIEIAGIEVSGARAPVDVTDASVTQTVTREEIDELPVLGRDFTDFISLSGVVAPDPATTTGGQFSIAGQRGSQTNIQIDGVDANNSFFGENRGGARIPFVFSLESIQEFQVITNGYDVEYSNYSGGIVNVVTRGGSNKLSGTLFGNFRSDALTGKGFLDTLGVSDYSVAQYAARLSGPIKKDKAFFFLSLDGQRRREPQVPLTLSQYAPGGEDENPVADAEFKRFLAALKNVYGVSNPESGYAPFQTTNDVITLFGRLDWNFNEKHRLSLRHNFATYDNENEFSPGFDFVYGASRAEKLQDDSHSFVSELTSVMSANTFNVARFQFSWEGRPRLGHELRPALVARLSNGREVGYGGTFVAFNNNLEERKLQFIDNFTHVRGKHTFKVGGNAIFAHLLNSFLPALSGNPCGGSGSQGAGLFCFSDIASFEAGMPSSYTFNVATGDDIVPTSEFDAVSWGIYVQDEIALTPKLTLTAGLRHDQQSVLTSPQRVLDVERAFGYPTGTAPTDNNNISPRLSLAYDIKGDGQSVVRAGAGYFFSSVPYVLAGNVMGSANPVLNLSCRGSIAKGDPDAPPSPLNYGQLDPGGSQNPTACGSAAQLQGVPTYTVWNPDFEFPETFKANVGFETLLNRSTKISIDGLMSRSTKLYTVRNLNLRPVQFTLANEGGRQIFTPASSFSASGGNATSSRIYSNLGNVFVNYNDGAAQAYVLTSELNHRFGERANARVSYTFTKAYDNSSYSCCEANAGYTNPIIGAFGPNDIGGIGDEDKGWGPSSFSRDHTFILSGFLKAPFGFQVSTIYRLQSGRPFTPQISGDINGDGVSFNDRPFIFAAADLPLASTVVNADSVRTAYGNLLSENACIGDYEGQIIPRNTCRTPWTNSLDVRLTKEFETTRGQRAELMIDFFNVLNGLGSALCNDEDFRTAIRTGKDPYSGSCGWGRRNTISGANQNVFFSPTFQNGSITYSPSSTFARETVLGSNLQLQFQMQIGLRYTF